VVLATVGCAQAPAKTSQVVVALFDVSGSTRGQRQQYLRDFRRIVGCLAKDAESRARPELRLLADRITENPLAQSEFKINVAIKARDPRRDNPIAYKRLLDQTIGGILRQAESILGRLESGVFGTRIMDALLLAQKGIASYKRESNVLVVFSDMIEQSGRYDFSKIDLSARGIDTIIARERRDGRIPDLKGVRVYVIGAGAAQTGGLPPDRIMAIERFWLRYFEQAGAEMRKERYGAALIRFEDCE
jgi:RNase P/RNase MRP subunit POP5